MSIGQCHEYVALCAFGLPISLVVFVGVGVLYLVVISRSEVWVIGHFMALARGEVVREVVRAVCLIVFF